MILLEKYRERRSQDPDSRFLSGRSDGDAESLFRKAGLRLESARLLCRLMAHELTQYEAHPGACSTKLEIYRDTLALALEALAEAEAAEKAVLDVMEKCRDIKKHPLPPQPLQSEIPDVFRRVGLPTGAEVVGEQAHKESEWLKMAYFDEAMESGLKAILACHKEIKSLYRIY